MRISWQTGFLAAAVACAAGVIIAIVVLAGGGEERVPRSSASLTLAKIPFDGAQSYEYLEKLCEIGPRISGSAGMKKQQEMLAEHFRGLGAAEVGFQEFTVASPLTGEPTTLKNLVVAWHPERKQRILLCTHYDTRPYPDQDPVVGRRRDPFLGANDGASGTALLMELGKHMKELDGPIGVDFVFFDAEEWIYSSRDEYFLGSEHFAEQYRDRSSPALEYKYGVLLDMVGDRDLQLYYERNSMRMARPLAEGIWSKAAELDVREFIPRVRHEVRDDHLKLNEIAAIPTIDMIDFDYPSPQARGVSYWHTTQDVPRNCSALSLAKVGWVLLEWLKDLE